MIGRRLFLKGGAAAVTVRGGNPPMRPDQIANLPQTRAGSGPAPASPFVTARRVVIIGPGASGGLFVYSGTPAAGNLIASIVAATGTDPYGNAYLAGITSYNEATGVMVNEQNGILTFGSIATPANRTPFAVTNLGKVTASPPTGQPFTVNGTETVINGLNVTGGITADTVTITPAGATLFIANSLSFPVGVAGEAQLVAIGGQLGQVNASGLATQVSGGQLAAVSPVTVTQAAFTSLFNSTILANDAVVGATYKASAFGFGAWGSTVQDLVFGIRFGATDATTIGTNPDINSASFAASALFRWEAEAVLTCVTTGATAHWVANIKGMVTQTANSILVGTAGTNSISFTGGTGSGTVTLDSTVNEIFGISAHWAATTGAPTLTAVSGIMERIA